MERSLKHLSFQSLRHGLTLCFLDISDRRQKGKVDHSIHDVTMSGFAQFKGIALSEGQNPIRFAFRPILFIISFILSLSISSLVLTAWVFKPLKNALVRVTQVSYPKRFTHSP